MNLGREEGKWEGGRKRGKEESNSLPKFEVGRLLSVNLIAIFMFFSGLRIIL